MITSIKIKGKAVSFGMFAWNVIRFVIIFGLSFMIMQPFIIKILMALMSPNDLIDQSVNLIPKNFSLFYWKAALNGLELSSTLPITIFMAVTIALIQCFIPAFIAYGLARLEFRGRKLAFIFVIIIWKKF